MPYKNKSDANANQRRRLARDPEKTKAYYRKRVRNYRAMREVLKMIAYNEAPTENTGKLSKNLALSCLDGIDG